MTYLSVRCGAACTTQRTDGSISPARVCTSCNFISLLHRYYGLNYAERRDSQCLLLDSGRWAQFSTDAVNLTTHTPVLNLTKGACRIPIALRTIDVALQNYLRYDDSQLETIATNSHGGAFSRVPSVLSPHPAMFCSRRNLVSNTAYIIEGTLTSHTRCMREMIVPANVYTCTASNSHVATYNYPQ